MDYENWKAIYVEKTDEKRNVKLSGAITSTLNNKNDPTYEKRDKSARDFYEQAVQNRESFIKNIAQNGNISRQSAEKIFDHIFVEKHNLRSGFRKFDPDYDRAESFKRIIDGEDIQVHDLIMLKHECLELGLMRRYNYDYDKAHRITEHKYNYKAALEKWLKERGGW